MTTTERTANTRTLYFEGDDLYNDMLAAIDGARERVWMESYIFSADPIGQRFAAALSRAARRGLDVRLHVDAVGSLFQLPAGFLRTLEEAGVTFRSFHRWSWRDPWRYNRRNHCKLLITDRDTVFLGGFNIHRENSASLFGPQRWRDTHIRLHDTGLTAQAIGLFETFWSGRVPAWLQHRNRPERNHGDTLISNRLPRHRFALRRLYHRGLLAARHEVLLTTPYFAPDRRTRRLLQRGIRLHEYRPRTLHAKTMVVDRGLATIGTANLDYRSLLHNYEINFVTRDAATCEALAQRFDGDLDESETITLGHLPRRRWWERLAGVVGWQLRHWL